MKTNLGVHLSKSRWVRLSALLLATQATQCVGRGDVPVGSDGALSTSGGLGGTNQVSAASGGADSGEGLTPAAGGANTTTGGSNTTTSSSGSGGQPNSFAFGIGGAGTASSALSETWEGYVENYMFADQSDAVKLELVSDGVAIGGHITFGTSAPPPPVADPKVGYPPAANGDPGKLFRPYPGFRFTMRNASLNGSRIQFDVSTAELWSEWCAQQVPVLDTFNVGPIYGCLPNGATMFGGTECALMEGAGPWVPVDCVKLDLCMNHQICGCTAQGCSVSDSGDMHFDMQMVAPKADGSVAGLNGAPLNVHLTRR